MSVPAYARPFPSHASKRGCAWEGALAFLNPFFAHGLGKTAEIFGKKAKKKGLAQNPMDQVLKQPLFFARLP